MPLLPNRPLTSIQPPNEQTILFTGPPLSEGPLPAIFYFCSTADESLNKDPYCQPVDVLSVYPIRIFSMSLPLHEEAPDRRKAVSLWASALEKGNDPLTPFLEHVCANIDYLIAENVITPNYLGLAGLSRGGWIATHVAARSSHVKAVTAFAPLTDLQELPHFQHLDLHEMALTQVIQQLIGIPIRYYIGNHDTRVGTDACIQFIQSLITASHHRGLRTIPVELMMSRAIGHEGHGTPPHVFRSGALWLAAQLGILSQDEGYFP